jgi:hypothetical protein
VIARYEYKVPCEPARLPEIEAWVRLQSAAWRTSYPPRQVNNVYFDSPDLHDLNANLSGVGRREKLRLRWYGPDLTRISGAQLELKCKDGVAGWKDIVYFAGELELTGWSWPTLVTTLRGGLEARAKLWLDCRGAPVLINSYRRDYYESPDGVLRVTLDTHLRAYDQRFSMAPNLDRPSLQPEQMVVELKGPVDDDAARRLSQVLMTLPVRVDRFSKYLRGMLAAADFEGMLG